MRMEAILEEIKKISAFVLNAARSKNDFEKKFTIYLARKLTHPQFSRANTYELWSYRVMQKSDSTADCYTLLIVD